MRVTWFEPVMQTIKNEATVPLVAEPNDSLEILHPEQSIIKIDRIERN